MVHVRHGKAPQQTLLAREFDQVVGRNRCFVESPDSREDNSPEI